MADIYKSGDVIDVDLGKPPMQVKGHEQGFVRPCVVVKSLERLGLLIILPLSTKEQKYALYTIVKLAPGNSGLTEVSYALCHQIRTVSIERIKKKRASILPRELNTILAVLKDMLEL